MNSWLSKFPRSRAAGDGNMASRQNNTLNFEHLESRQLLAADLGSLSFKSTAEAFDFSADSSATALTAEGEGDADIDLVALAKDIAAAGTKLFSAAWCQSCTDQREFFEDGGVDLPFIEVTTPARTANDIAIQEGITQIPTWEFPDGSRHVGMLFPEAIAERSGLAVPTSSLPSLRPIETANVEFGSPLHIPVDAYDPDDESLEISVVSSNPNVISAEVLTGNRSLLLETAGYGDMLFALFESRAPRPSGRVIELAESGFYDNVPFHRVVNNFVIQGGDPTGSGRGGSDLGDFDDQFNLDLQHNRPGVLSYAKSADDTNDSQFFVTEVATRYLDFNHSIFGQLIEGEHVRDAISNSLTNFEDRPVFDVVIRSASILSDSENGLILLRSMTDSGTSEITVTVSDAMGNSVSESFIATAGPEVENGAPFLDPIPSVPALSGSSVQIQLSSQDGENDPVEYFVEQFGETPFEVGVNATSGLVTFQVPQDFTGQLSFLAGVSQTVDTDTGSKTDTQLVTIQVYEHSPHQNALLASDVNDDGVTTPLDALLIINYLNNTAGNPNIFDLPEPPPLMDVNGDLFISPIDSLLVINALNAEGEGEAEEEPWQAFGQAIASYQVAPPLTNLWDRRWLVFDLDIDAQFRRERRTVFHAVM